VNVVEVFSGAGGLAEAIRRAGVEVGMAFDVDADACSTYERNLGVRPVRVDARDLVRMVASGWTCGRVDLLVMDPPCASTAGLFDGQPSGTGGRQRLESRPKRDWIASADRILRRRLRSARCGRLRGSATSISDVLVWAHRGTVHSMALSDACAFGALRDVDDSRRGTASAACRGKRGVRS